jgi:hypothetical protein
MKRIVLTFGLIAGAVLSAMMIITMPFHEQIGFDRALVIGYTSMVLAFLLIFFGVRSYRDNVAGGVVGFGRALVVGVSIGAVAGLCYTATWQVLHDRIAPDYMEKYEAHMLAKARADGESEEAIALQKAEMEQFAEMYKNPLIMAAFTFLEPLPVAVIVALVSAGVLSRRRGAIVNDGVLRGERIAS